LQKRGIPGLSDANGIAIGRDFDIPENVRNNLARRSFTAIIDVCPCRIEIRRIGRERRRATKTYRQDKAFDAADPALLASLHTSTSPAQLEWLPKIRRAVFEQTIRRISVANLLSASALFQMREFFSGRSSWISCYRRTPKGSTVRYPGALSSMK
jgi:hypothetical protein